MMCCFYAVYCCCYCVLSAVIIITIYSVNNYFHINTFLCKRYYENIDSGIKHDIVY